jgi:molybdopterin biosynthesis enzyme
MIQRLPPSLTPLDVALAALSGLAPVAPVDLPLAAALGCIAADNPFPAHPPHDVAAIDGWALRANDLVGASSYSPVPLAIPPIWVEAGDAMPAGCDCVIDADAVDASGSVREVLAEGTPGRGVRRAGSDIAEGPLAVAAGRPVRAADLLLARAAGLESLNVRRVRLRVINIPGGTATASTIADLARAAGAETTSIEAKGRDAAAIADVLDTAACDLLLTIGGSGVGHHDAAIAALAQRGEVLVHGIALQPGITTAIGRIAGIPVIALPGSPDEALAAWLALTLPAIDRLSARRPRPSTALPLARKIASHVGIAEIALLAEHEGKWLPLAVGQWPLHAVARAAAWLMIPGGSEGFAADTPVDAYLTQE